MDNYEYINIKLVKLIIMEIHKLNRRISINFVVVAFFLFMLAMQPTSVLGEQQTNETKVKGEPPLQVDAVIKNPSDKDFKLKDIDMKHGIIDTSHPPPKEIKAGSDEKFIALSHSIMNLAGVKGTVEYSVSNTSGTISLFFDMPFIGDTKCNSDASSSTGLTSSCNVGSFNQIYNKATYTYEYKNK